MPTTNLSGGKSIHGRENLMSKFIKAEPHAGVDDKVVREIDVYLNDQFNL